MIATQERVNIVQKPRVSAGYIVSKQAFKSITFEVGADVQALPYLTASAEYLMGYMFSDHPLREPRKTGTVTPEELNDLFYGLFGS